MNKCSDMMNPVVAWRPSCASGPEVVTKPIAMGLHRQDRTSWGFSLSHHEEIRGSKVGWQ